MPTEAASIAVGHRLRLAGDILWLGISAGVCAVIVGIVCWSLSAERSPGTAAGRPTAAVIPDTSTGSAAVSPSPTFGTNRTLAPGSSSSMADASRGDGPSTSVAALTEPAGIKSQRGDPIADQPQTSAPANHDALATPLSGLQPAQSASAAPASHGLGPRRPPQHHQRARPAAPGGGTALAPW